MDTPSALDLAARGSRRGKEYHNQTSSREEEKVHRFL
jgi:hypothetical protein